MHQPSRRPSAARGAESAQDLRFVPADVDTTDGAPYLLLVWASYALSAILIALVVSEVAS